MKKLLCLAMVVLIVLGIGEITAAADSTDKPLIAVASMRAGARFADERKYYENVVGPTLGWDFLFYEGVDDLETLLSFMEGAYAMGAKGVLNYYTPGTLKGSELAEELGMFFSTQASRLPKFEEGSTQAYNLGNVGASVDGVASAYKQAFEALLSDGKDHSVIIYTILAPDKRAASHYYSTQAILETMQAHYGLTYSDSIDALINNYLLGNRDGESENQDFPVPRFQQRSRPEQHQRAAVFWGL